MSEPFELSGDELSALDQYRKVKDSSVLVILFTDIKNFRQIINQRGTAYAQTILKYRDEIVIKALEADHGGAVIKRTEDSLLAVFPDPSVAVERALKVQEHIRQFTQTHPDLERIEVRIGIHMGQVAIGNKSELELFGRQVVRAARVEELADSGQIYLTQPVFENARDWLKSQGTGNLSWKFHGQYYLDTAVDIYEVTDRRFGRPKAPQHARKKTSQVTLWISGLCLLIGIAIPMAFLQYQHTETYMAKWNLDKTLIDQKEELLLDGTKAQEVRKVLNHLAPGKHLLEFVSHWQLKFYQEIEVKRGKNFFQPDFTRNYLPSLSRRLDYSRKEPKAEAKEIFTFRLYDKNGKRSDHQATLILNLKGIPDPKVRDWLSFVLDWEVQEDGKTLSHDQLTLSSKPSGSDEQRKTMTIFEDPMHYYFMRYFVEGASAELELGAAYIEFKDK